MSAADYPQKITFAEMRESGVGGMLIYCADYRCSTSLATFDLSNATYRPFADGLGFVGETMMKHALLALATLLAASGDNSAFAQYYCPGGQRPVPPAIAERMALPLCGFDAAKRWTGNMCQLSTRGICIRTHLSQHTLCHEAAITTFGDYPNASMTGSNGRQCRPLAG